MKKSVSWSKDFLRLRPQLQDQLIQNMCKKLNKVRLNIIAYFKFESTYNTFEMLFAMFLTVREYLVRRGPTSLKILALHRKHQVLFFSNESFNGKHQILIFPSNTLFLRYQVAQFLEENNIVVAIEIGFKKRL